MPKIIREVDHVVLLPRCSRHALAGATLGMKAAVGYWRTDSRLEYHHDAATFHEKTAEANTVTSLKEKQRLTLTVANKIQATGAEKLLRNDLAAIWDDRVLKRAFELFGGVPRLRFIEANSGVPTELRRRLTTMTTIPGYA